MHKRVLILSVLLLMLLSCVSCVKQHDLVSADYSALQYSSHSFIYRYDDDSVQKMSADGNEVVYPASITKLLTALTALEILPADTLITPGDEVYFPPDGASSAYIRPHHQLTLEMLIEAMMLPSGNDAAYAVAAACGKQNVPISENEQFSYEEAVKTFVKRMNEYARELGCTGSNFTTPDGFAGEEHYSTLDDMMLICRAAAENEIIAKYAAMQSDDVIYASGHTNRWVNTNFMLDPESEFYNEHVIGLKTGSLDGNYSLVTLYDDGKHRFLIGVFGADSDKGRYIDIQNLIQAVLKAADAIDVHQCDKGHNGSADFLSFAAAMPFLYSEPISSDTVTNSYPSSRSTGIIIRSASGVGESPDTKSWNRMISPPSTDESTFSAI